MPRRTSEYPAIGVLRHHARQRNKLTLISGWRTRYTRQTTINPHTNKVSTLTEVIIDTNIKLSPDHDLVDVLVKDDILGRRRGKEGGGLEESIAISDTKYDP